MEIKDLRTQRYAQLYPTKNNRFQTEWTLTDTALADLVKISVPPFRVIPIVFVPGIMGSNLANSGGSPIWLLNSVKDVPAGLAYTWSQKTAAERQVLLHPRRTQVYKLGAVPKESAGSIGNVQDYVKRGWGEVSEASYHKFLMWLERKMNSEQNPMFWDDFSAAALKNDMTMGEKLALKLPAGLTMKMVNLPENAEKGHPVEPIKSDDLLRRAKARFPVYAFGYNWLESNKAAAVALKKRINAIIDENSVGAVKCSQVILVTHSMGGLVARACSILPDMTTKIVGIVHGVMPATGAAVAYRRCKIGMRDESFGASLVIGSNGQEVTAVFAQAPGALQLLPS